MRTRVRLWTHEVINSRRAALREEMSACSRRTAVDDYLSTIYRLEEVFGVARTTDISRELGVRPATVSKVLRRLASEGYVVWTRFRGFRLSEKGSAAIRPLVRRHRICEVFLSMLGFDPLEAHEYAHYMEHLPQRIVESIYRYVGAPRECPHGNPIPGEGASPRGKPLSEFRSGDVVEVVGYRGELVTHMRRSLEAGLVGGARVEIVSKRGRAVCVRVGDEVKKLDLKTAMTVLVKRVE